MVEKNVAYNRDGRSEEFADNDPMAELARIVGFEDRPSHVAPLAAQRPASPVIERREPEFNLEDELLREFEIYDAPRAEPLGLEPSGHAPASAASGPGSFLERVESVFGSRYEPEADGPEPQVTAHSDFRPLLDTGRPVTDLRDDFSSDEVFYEPAEEPAIATHVAEVPVVDEAPVTYEDVSEIYEPVEYAPETVAEFTPEPVAEAAAEWHELPSWPGDEHQGFTAEPAAQVEDVPAVAEHFDLASEVEMAVAEKPAAPVIQRRSSLEFSSLRLPLANFGARRDPVVEAPVAAPLVQPVVEAPHSDLSNDYYESIETPVQQPVSIASVPAEQTLSAMDELIYDVARYSIRNNDVEASQPAAHLQPVEEAPVTISAPVQSPVPTRSEPSFAVADDVGDFEGFADDAFELALEDIDFDIDLSDIDDVDADARKSVETLQEYSEPVAPAPVPVAPVEPAPVQSLPPRVAQPVADIPRYQERHSAAPVAGTVAAPAAYEPATLESLPFDPSQIGETEDQPETIGEMEVPDLPVGVFEPKPAVRRSEEEMDIDSELATFFAPTAAGGFDRHKHVDARNGQSQVAAMPPEQADEFERALEEDFRRSMQEASASRAQAHHESNNAFPQQPVHHGNDDRGARRWIVPVAALGLVLVAGGVYALMSGGSEGSGVGGAPVVISADNEPLKVVPENPGGTTVPNQDKAVYDRVAGGAPQDPKQSSLISSSEEPVDVVQRTLIPENLPLEGEGEDDVGLGSTPVGETEDPRLLSREETAQGGQTDGNSPVNVAPRKVRTMIVKPDGTLVAQEVPEPSAPQATPSVVANNSAADEVIAPQAGQPAEQAPDVLSSTPVPVATPATQASAQTPSAAAFPAADTQVATAPQARAAAPVPSARPAAAQQPAQSAPATTAVAPTQTAQAPAQAAAPASTSAAPAGGYYIQIASLPSEAEAQRSYQSLSGKFGSVIGGRGVDIKRADIEGRGTYYRVRIPAGDRSAANTMCERYRAAGGSCLVAR